MSATSTQPSVESLYEQIGRLSRQLEDVRSTLASITITRDRYKREAGFDSNVSFDVVWKVTLEAAKRNESSHNEEQSLGAKMTDTQMRESLTEVLDSVEKIFAVQNIRYLSQLDDLETLTQVGGAIFNEYMYIANKAATFVNGCMLLLIKELVKSGKLINDSQIQTSALDFMPATITSEQVSMLSKVEDSLVGALAEVNSLLVTINQAQELGIPQPIIMELMGKTYAHLATVLVEQRDKNNVGVVQQNPTKTNPEDCDTTL